MRILYIDIDCLRPDHLGCYGYHRNTSPAIDRIAQEGVVFERVYTSDAPCLPSRTALYSGRFGIQTGVVGHGGTAGQPKIQGQNRTSQDYFGEQGLARELQRAGYWTAMISPFGQRHTAWHFYAGFNEILNTGQGGMESAEMIQPTVDRWLSQHVADDHWFLHINYWDAHTPYRVPTAYGDPFANDPLPAWLDDEDLIRQHNLITGPHTSREINMYNGKENPAFPRHPGEVIDRKSMRRMVDGYDTGVRYVDDQVAKIVATLKKADVYEDTAIIISADHGENIGELGIYAEHATADEPTCHIPLIVKFPGAQQGTRDRGFHYNIDIAPTLADLIGGSKQPLWDGDSFVITLLHGQEAGREELVLSQCAHVCQRSVRWKNWLYLRTYHDGFRLFPREMIFDIEADPHEQNDLAATRPDLCQEGAWRLVRWHDAQMDKMAQTANDVVDPLWTVIREGGPSHANLGPSPGYPGPEIFQDYLEHLRQTNRQVGADLLQQKYARFLTEKTK